MKLFSIYDRATEAYSAPFAQPNANAALRAIKNEMRNPDSQLTQHPSDFELWELGTFDEHHGDLIAEKTRVARIEDVAGANNAS